MENVHPMTPLNDMRAKSLEICSVVGKNFEMSVKGDLLCSFLQDVK